MMYFMIFLITMFGGMSVVFALLFGPGLAFVLDGKMMFIKLLYSRFYAGVNKIKRRLMPCSRTSH